MKRMMEKMERVLSAVLTLVLLVGLAPAAALAEEEPSASPESVVGDVPDTAAPSEEPEVTAEPSPEPTEEPTPVPTAEPTPVPTAEPTADPTAEPEIAVPPTATPAPVIAVPPIVTPEPAVQAPVTEENEAEFDPMEDPLYQKIMDRGGISVVSAASKAFDRFTPRQTQGRELVRRGIDVSVYQHGIDWNAVKASGVEFAIIRGGYRGSSNGKLAADTYAGTNLAGAKAAGLKVGAYFFSQATTVEEAREEARYLVNVVKGYQIDLPLVFDFEEVSSSSRRLKMSKLSRQLMTDMCNAFCQEVEQAGYQSMVYTNPNTLSKYLYEGQLGRLWLAHWTTATNHAHTYEYWQCGEGPVEGVSGNVDLDFWFDPEGIAIPPGGGSSAADPSASPEATDTPEPTPTPTSDIATPPTSTPMANVQNPFQDVTSGKWFYDSVLWAYSKGIVKGLSETSFGPNGTATRGQLVTMLYRMAGQPAVPSKAGFTDLKEAYYVDAVNWAAANNITSGFSSTVFAPNNKITREQLAVMLYRIAGSPEVTGDLSKFSDSAAVHDYAVNALIWAVEKGVVTGYSNGKLMPGSSATRAEVCTMLSRFAAL